MKNNTSTQADSKKSPTISSYKGKKSGSSKNATRIMCIVLVSVMLLSLLASAAASFL